MALLRRQDPRTRSGRSLDPAQSSGVGNFFDEVDTLLNQLATPAFSGSQWAQGYPVDLYETADEFVVEMAVPGIAVEGLDISIEGRQLSIQGTLPASEDENRRYWLQSIPRGQFRRTVTLPAGIEADQIHATVDDGLLVLRAPKAAEVRARKIAVHNG